MGGLRHRRRARGRRLGRGGTLQQMGDQARYRDARPVKHRQPLTEILQLPDVSPPGAALQQTAVAIAQFQRTAVALPSLEVPKEALRQQRDVLLPLPQRGQIQLQDIQAVIEIAAEFTCPDQRLQVLVGGRDHPDIDGSHLTVPQPHDLPLLQDPQQPPLKSQGDLRDLVQKDGAVVGDLKQARLTAPGGAGEGALHIAEQLALQQVLRQGGAVDGYEVVL